MKDGAEHIEWHKDAASCVHDVLGLSFPELPSSNRGAAVVRHGCRCRPGTEPWVQQVVQQVRWYLELVVPTHWLCLTSVVVRRSNGHVALIGQSPAVNFLSFLDLDPSRSNTLPPTPQLYQHIVARLRFHHWFASPPRPNHLRDICGLDSA